MRSKWILIGQSFLKTMRTIGDKPEREASVIMREITAGFGRHGAKWVNKLLNQNKTKNRRVH